MPVVLPKRPQSFLSRTPVASAVLLALASPALMAQETSVLGEVIVTAQKRSESLQDVPISIDALGEEKMKELNVQNFKDYVQFLPTVTMSPSPGSGSGFNAVYMRGVATGGDGQATTSQPSVGMYLDEQPITTVQGNLDVHLYDIARVEALAGPQGTLYGASSQAGTIRIITNKPDPAAFAAGYSLEANYVDMEEPGYVAEGFVNLPLSDNAALRFVGWSVSDAGWVDNRPASRTYTIDQSTPDDDLVTTNDEFAEKNYNTSDTIGARAALRINLGDNWTFTPNVSYQRMDQEGSWGDDLKNVGAGGAHSVAHFRPEFTDDEWWQAGLTIEGSMNGFDVVYSGNYLNRDVDGSFDYTDYSFYYDNLYTTGYFSRLFLDNNGVQNNPDASFSNNDHYTKASHELRVTTPQDKRVRGLLGFFYQKQYHDFYQEFGRIANLANIMEMNFLDTAEARFPGVVYLNSMDRTDTDQAVFASVDFDLTDQFVLSLGARYFEPEVHVKGFFGFGLGFNRPHTPGYGRDNIPDTGDDQELGEVGEPGDPRNGGEGAFLPEGQAWSRDGEWRCAAQVERKDAPCQNVDKGISESDSVYRVNLTWKATDTAMLYATWSEGYRPGGINRNPFAGTYIRDILTNYELGWKTRFADDRVQLNGAVFLEDWDDIQVAFQGGNGITQVANGGKAQIKGIEAQLDWLPTDNLRLGLALAYYDSELKKNFCDQDSSDGDDDGNITECLVDADTGETIIRAPTGTPLPLTPDFKANLIARYSFPVGAWESYVQGAFTYQTDASSQLDLVDNATYGDIPSSSYVNLSFGLQKDKYSLELFLANATDEDAPLGVTSECSPGVCGVLTYGVQSRPRTIGLRFSQDF